MSRDASNQVFRQFRAIFDFGPVGGMTDAQLIILSLSVDEKIDEPRTF